MMPGFFVVVVVGLTTVRFLFSIDTCFCRARNRYTYPILSHTHTHPMAAFNPLCMRRSQAGDAAGAYEFHNSFACKAGGGAGVPLAAQPRKFSRKSLHADTHTHTRNADTVWHLTHERTAPSSRWRECSTL